MSSHPNRSQTNRNVGENPKPAEIRCAREAVGLTQQQAADLLFSSWRTWQHWESDGPENRRMPAAAWELFTVKCNARRMLREGEISPAMLRKLGLYLPPLESEEK